jgi:hypothetical protein
MTTINISSASTNGSMKIVHDFQDSYVTLTNISSSGNSGSSTNFFKIYLPDTTKSSFTFTNDSGATVYSTTNLYIYRLIHDNIKGITDNTSAIIGEAVVELTSSTNANKAYLCFLLDYTSGVAHTQNDIDDMLLTENVAKELTVNMSNIIASGGSCIEYQDTKNTSNNVFVFTTPIHITSTTAATITTNTKSTNTNGSSNGTGYDTSSNLFSKNPPTTYYNISTSNITHNGEKEIEIDCHPIDGFHTLFETFESKKVVEGATFMVPSSSTTAELDRIADVHKMTVYGCIFCMAAVLIYFIVPLVYKFLVIDKVIRLSKTDSGYSSKIEAITDIELTRIRSIDVCISVFFMGLVGYFFYLGAVASVSYLAIGFFILFAFLMSFATIQLKKGEYDFMKTVVTETSTTSETYPMEQKEAEALSFKILSGKDIFQFLLEVGKFVFSKSCIPAILAVEVTFLAVMLILTYAFHQIREDTFASITIPVMVAVIPIGISLLSAIGIAPFPTVNPNQ